MQGCVNHGPTTSIYYRDPDGNDIETQVDNFDTTAEADEFFASEAFAINRKFDIPLEKAQYLDCLISRDIGLRRKKFAGICPEANDTVSGDSILK